MVENIQTYEDLFDYCKKYAKYIFVREKIDGKWKSVALSELEMDIIMKHINGWWNANIIPSRLKTEEELKNAP